MRYSDWKMIGDIGVILGIIFLVGGVWLWLNIEGYMGSGGWWEYYKYRGYTMPLLVLGIVLFVVGFVARLRTEEEKRLKALPTPLQPVPPSRVTMRFCTNCGTKISAGAKYCPSCGQKIQA